MRRFRICLVLWGVVALAHHDYSASAAENEATNARGKTSVARKLVEDGGLLIIAHRGDSAIAPENTLPAFDSAVKAKSDLVELDYYHSADGVPVVFHDKTLDRTTNAVKLWNATKIEIQSKPLSELLKLDAGSWFDEKFAGTRIPTLDESLDLIQNGSITLIEQKGGDPATCVELLKKKNLLDQVVVQSFDWEYLTGCHALAPDLVLGALGHKELTPEKLDQVAKTGAKVVGWEDKFLTAEGIAAIHARGWKAWVWTVDKPERAQELVAAGIDGIITNRPAATRAAVQAKP